MSAVATSSSQESISRKRTRSVAMQQPADPSGQPQSTPVGDNTFIADVDAQESGGDDDDEEGVKSDKKAGRRKIKIEFIQDKSRRHITFSKRKAGESLSRQPPSSYPLWAPHIFPFSFTSRPPFSTPSLHRHQQRRRRLPSFF